MIDSTTPVKVYNHSTCNIGMAGQLREYMLPGAKTAPTVLTMPFSEVEYIHSRSNVFASGALQFDPAVRDDVYKALYFDNWEDVVLFDEEIARIIRENDLKAAEKFLRVQDIATIQRIRGQMIGLANTSSVDISKRMIDLIEARYDEINHGVRQSKVRLETAVERAQADEDPRILALQEQLRTMQEQMQAMMEMQTAAKKPAAKRAARPAAAKQPDPSADTTGETA